MTAEERAEIAARMRELSRYLTGFRDFTDLCRSPSDQAVADATLALDKATRILTTTTTEIAP